VSVDFLYPNVSFCSTINVPSANYNSYHSDTKSQQTFLRGGYTLPHIFQFMPILSWHSRKGIQVKEVIIFGMWLLIVYGLVLQ
jgi:hypothetical protein